MMNCRKIDANVLNTTEQSSGMHLIRGYKIKEPFEQRVSSVTDPFCIERYLEIIYAMFFSSNSRTIKLANTAYARKRKEIIFLIVECKHRDDIKKDVFVRVVS